MSEKSSSSGSDEDVEPESGQPGELGGVLSKVSLAKSVSMLKCLFSAEITNSICVSTIHQ